MRTYKQVRLDATLDFWPEVIGDEHRGRALRLGLSHSLTHRGRPACHRDTTKGQRTAHSELGIAGGCSKDRAQRNLTAHAPTAPGKLRVASRHQQYRLRRGMSSAQCNARQPDYQHTPEDCRTNPGTWVRLDLAGPSSPQTAIEHASVHTKSVFYKSCRANQRKTLAACDSDAHREVIPHNGHLGLSSVCTWRWCCPVQHQHLRWPLRGLFLPWRGRNVCWR